MEFPCGLWKCVLLGPEHTNEAQNNYGSIGDKFRKLFYRSLGLPTAVWIARIPISTSTSHSYLVGYHVQ